jgi:hypothetical protein
MYYGIANNFEKEKKKDGRWLHASTTQSLGME